MADVLLGSCKPVLHRQEVGTHVLCGAGDEAQDLGNALEHGQLLCARRGFGRLAGGLAAPQALQEAHQAALGAVHLEAAKLGEADDLSG